MLTAAVAALILVLSLIPQMPRVMEGFKYTDKLGHFAAYIVLGFILFLSLVRENRHKALWIAVAYCVVFGAVIEGLQHFVHRQTELWDLIVDLLGALVGALAGWLVLRSWPGLIRR